MNIGLHGLGFPDAAVYLECNCREKALHLVCYLFLFQVELLKLVFVAKLQGVAYRVEGLAWVHLGGSQHHQKSHVLLQTV